MEDVWDSRNYVCFVQLIETKETHLSCVWNSEQSRAMCEGVTTQLEQEQSSETCGDTEGIDWSSIARVC